MLLVVRCAVSLLRGKIERETWGRLTLPDGDYGEFHHWENTVGRSRRSDVVLQSPTVSRSHAAFLRDEKGQWSVYALNSKNGLTVNDQEVAPQEHMPIQSGDIISMGGVEVTFTASTAAEELAQALSEYIKLFDKLMKGYLGGRLDDHEVEAAYFSHMRNEKIHV